MMTYDHRRIGAVALLASVMLCGQAAAEPPLLPPPAQFNEEWKKALAPRIIPPPPPQPQREFFVMEPDPEAPTLAPFHAAILAMYDRYNTLWTSATTALEKTMDTVCGKSEDQMNCRAVVMMVVREHRS